MAVPKFILSFSDILSIFYFIGIGIINFFINYKDMYEDYNIEEKKRIRRYSRYYMEYIVIIVKEFASFIEPDWEKLKKNDN
jgi:hypothetical protein